MSLILFQRICCRTGWSLVLASALATAASAELVIFSHGGFLKVAAYEVQGDSGNRRAPRPSSPATDNRL